MKTYLKWLAAVLVLSVLFAAFTCNPLTAMFRWFNCTPTIGQDHSTPFRRSNCKLIEKIPSGQHCSLAAMLKKRLMALNRLLACNVVFYNRVPKCASRTVLGIFKQLACQNGYKYASEIGPQNITKEEVVFFARGLMNTQKPLFFARHLHYINFSSLHLKEPVYINVIRDPLQRAISHYNYNTYGSNSKPLIQPILNYNTSLDECVQSGKGGCWHMAHAISFFCGHSSECRRGGGVALRRAKRTVREKYLLVGLTEDLPAFMETLSHLMPHFFTNATAIYNAMAGDLWQKYRTVKKQYISNETVSILSKHLGTEIEFYKFVRQRFYYIHRRVCRSKKAAFSRGWFGDVTLSPSRDTNVMVTS